MRLLERIISTQATGTTLTVDTAARGARSALIQLQPAGAGITGACIIDDRIIDPTLGNINNRVALWFYDTVDSTQGSYIFTPLVGDQLPCNNSSGGSVRWYVSLFDSPIQRPHGCFTRYLRASTLAALAVFTEADMAVGRFGTTHLMFSTDRAADIFVDQKTTTAGTYVTTGVINIAAAGGGVVTAQLTFQSPVWRVRVRNNDAALLMTYNVSAYVPPLVL